MADMLDLMKADPKLKFVLKEFPVLGEGSTQAAQVAVGGAHAGQDRRQEIPRIPSEAARRPRLRPTRRARSRSPRRSASTWRSIEKDMASDEVKATLEESFKLAEALGLNGTPSYVVGADVVIGAVGLPMLQGTGQLARCGKATCC